MERNVQVAIIGAGTAGINAMLQVRKQTDDFVLINGGQLGTTCARVGCMPSKALIQIAEDYHRRHVFQGEGIGHAEALSVDLSQAMTHVRELRDEFVDGIVKDTTAPLGDRFIEGYAEFIGPSLLKVNDQTVRADAIIIATGSRPVIPDQWRQFEDRLLTTDTLFEQHHLPKDMAVIGLGAVGLEMGMALKRLGINICGFEAGSNIGGLQDPEINEAAVAIMGRELPIFLDSETQIEKRGDRLRVIAGDRAVSVDKILVSIGRRPNIEGLHLERIGIELGRNGLPPFDPDTLQLEDHSVFIAGDVNEIRPVLHEVTHDGNVAGYNAVHDPTASFPRKTPMAICFTDPNICRVGAAWSDIENHPPAIGTARFDGGREKIMLRNEGVIRLYADRMGGKLIGSEMVAPRGEHLAHLIAWSIHQEQTVFDLLSMPYYHPCVEETLRSALLDLADDVDPERSNRPRAEW